MPLIVLTGASGSGKTTLAEAAAALGRSQLDIHFFDWIDVPSVEKMIAEYGSVEAWQKAKTATWMGLLAPAVTAGRQVLLEGQMRFAFIRQAAAAAGIRDCYPMLVDCDDATRLRRLSLERHQPDLASAAMLSWARFLRREASEFGYPIVDTTAASIDVSIDAVVSIFATRGEAGSDTSLSCR